MKIKITVGKINEDENYYHEKMKTKNVGKPYSNIMSARRDTAVQTQTGFQFFD